MTVIDHFRKNKIAYIAAGAAIGAGLAGTTAAYAYGRDPAGSFATGVRDWGMTRLGNHVASLGIPAGLGLHAGPNPTAVATGFRSVGTDVYTKPLVGLAERNVRRDSDHLRGPNWGPLGGRTIRV